MIYSDLRTKPNQAMCYAMLLDVISLVHTQTDHCLKYAMKSGNGIVCPFDIIVASLFPY